MMLNVLAGYDRLDIASVEHPAEDYVKALEQPVTGFRVGVARAPVLRSPRRRRRHGRGRRAAGAGETDEASLTDTMLPSTRDINVGAETYAYHEDLFAKQPGRYMIPTRRSLQNGANAKAADYVRGRWQLELLRRTIDDAFQKVDLVVLPTRRRTPRTVDASIKREETDIPRNPELENTGAVQRLRHPGDLGSVRLHVDGTAGRADDRGPTLLGGQGARARARVRAGDRLPQEEAADPPRHAGAAAGDDRRGQALIGALGTRPRATA